MKAKRYGGPTKKQAAAFKRSVAEYLAGVGARLIEGKRYELDIPFGILDIEIFDNWIHTRFSSPMAGWLYTATRCGNNVSNRYSGKWNWHYTTPVDSFNNFKFALEWLTKFELPQGFMAEAERLNRSERRQHDELVTRK
jgi:hypothetical protein